MNTTTATVTATAAAQGTALVYTGPVSVAGLYVSLASVTGGTVVTFVFYDNNVASSVTTAAGATWSGKSPGYSGQGPNTTRYLAEDYQYGRWGNQQGQTAPNGAGVLQYIPVTLASGNLDPAAAPTVKTAGTILADGNAAFTDMNSSSATGNVVAAVTAARELWRVSLVAGQGMPYTPLVALGANYGINVVASCSGATAISGSVTIQYDPLP